MLRELILPLGFAPRWLRRAALSCRQGQIESLVARGTNRLSVCSGKVTRAQLNAKAATHPAHGCSSPSNLSLRPIPARGVHALSLHPIPARGVHVRAHALAQRATRVPCTKNAAASRVLTSALDLLEQSTQRGVDIAKGAFPRTPATSNSSACCSPLLLPPLPRNPFRLRLAV